MENKNELKPGIKGKAELLVDQTQIASSFGSGLVEVFATPAMIALMEKAAHTSVQPFLPNDMVTVGSEVNIKHIKPTLQGVNVWAESELESIEGKKLTFKLEAFDQDGKIGFGTHTRYIVRSEFFKTP